MTSLERLPQLLRLAAGMPSYLRAPVDPAAARRLMADRMARRGELFVEWMRRLVFDRPESLYGRLIDRARIRQDELARQVRAEGVESTLEGLRDRGVYLTLDELQQRVPVRRDGVTIEQGPDALANPLLGAGIPGRSSGSRSSGTLVAYTWAFLEEEAAAECLLYEMHGVRDAPAAIWLPGPPGIAGIHNMLLHLKAARPPARWFSHSAPPTWTRSPFHGLVLDFMGATSRACGVPAPRLQHAGLEASAEVADWLAGKGATRSVRSLKTYASSAVRVAASARDRGLDLSGSVVFTGGEPLTAERRRFIESSGLTVRPRYVTTESGLVAGACPHAHDSAPDVMHVYQDRLTLTGGVTRAEGLNRSERSLAFTALSLHTPRVLLNAELGDFGSLDTRDCGCVFGSLGLRLHVSHVTSPEKVTGEGMNLHATHLHDIVARLVAAAGGSPDDYQLRTTNDARGLPAITVVVHPAVAAFDQGTFFHALWRELGAAGGGAALAAVVWRDAGTVQIVREIPRTTSGHKWLPADKRDAAGV